MRIYLDVSCLNWPFDDLSPLRVQMEANAVEMINEKREHYIWQLISSEMAIREINVIADHERRRKAH